MPSSKARSSPSGERRDRLTLAKLASYDDVATDALVDRAYFWTNTRKNRTKYNPARGIRDDEVAGIILRDIIVAKDAAKAEGKLLSMSGLKKYMAKLPTDREKEWFRRHLRKYVQMYLPDSPFEITTTNRYMVTEHEAAICARKFIKQGQEIKYLSGTLVPMTREEEQDLDLKRKDFSIVMSSRRKTPSFFLGPARFANHDCNANGRLVTRGMEGMQVMAIRNIHIGEEITVSYGDDYFGVDNCECLCLTCERAVRNGWAPQVDSDQESQASTPALTDEALSTDTLLSPKKRKRAQDTDSETSPASTPRKRTKFTRQSSKLKSEVVFSDVAPSIESATDQPAADTEISAQALSVPHSPVTEAVSDHVVHNKSDIHIHAESTTQSSTVTEPDSPSSLDADDSHRSSTSTVKVEEIVETSVRGATLAVGGNLDLSNTGLSDRERRLLGTDADTLSDLSDSLELDENLGTVVKKTRKSRNKEVVPSVEVEPPRARVPGDYTKTSRLLAQAYDRWVDCRTCNVWFVQQDSYLTRRECPRCERHSKLYGFQWPKTDSEGPKDDEERVMDHRTVHRFLYPEEEALVSRKDRGISFGITPTPELSEPHADTEDTLCFLLTVSITVAYEAPLVTLDYGQFQGSYDATYNLSYFRKIPFAASTAGENRFRAPQPPLNITNGTYDSDQSFDMCPQRTVNGSEDCLFLCLYSRPWVSTSASRPVLVVFYGGGFIEGSASFGIPPNAFPTLNVSTLNDYVVIYPNYRTNAFGFLPGQAIKDSSTSDLNPGLLDQQYALKWVQSYIDQFGGNPNNVTIWGQSAGGGSVVAQTLANGRGNNPKLFSKALASSPFWPKTYEYNAPQAEAIYTQLTDLTGCTNATDTLTCLKTIDVQTIRDASLVIDDSHTYTTSSYTWAPVIDGDFLIDTLTDAIDTDSLETGLIWGMYNTHEGENFIPSGLDDATTAGGFNTSTASFHSWLTGFVPGLSSSDISLIESKYYPVNGSSESISSYNTTFIRAGLVFRDLILACPAYWVASAAKTTGHVGEYSIPPARHGSDTIWWDTVNSVQETDPLIYEGYAGAFASFFQTGDPNAHKLTNSSEPGVPDLQDSGAEFVIAEDGFENVVLKQLKERCAFWKSVGKDVPV
ncbi:alpha/beta-hydrolase [Aspergillus ellipticus CBS 707.79]|uniref:Histone-lysine N-methyltransferase SET9 n=1 Tax=Aspergillus ellipticus CBS 707.79 TaxID=1448320 RepID=A0A319E569_9EURO|nr:alpha/beta-hydrolase [Aspergillus ellipticus CBS 707.79]